MSFAPSVSIFFLSVLFGAIFEVLWVAFKIIRTELNNSLKNLTFILDVIYFVLISIFTICFFFFFTSGGFRIFVIIGEILGFILLKTSIEKQLNFILSFFIKIVISLSKFIFKFIRKIFLKITNISEKNLVKTSKFTKEFVTKQFQNKNNFSLSLKRLKKHKKHYK